MVSPSKFEQQPKQRRPNIHGDITRTTNAHAAVGSTSIAAGNVRIQRGPKPLQKKIFYLDIKNHAVSAKLEAKIKELGGEIELFLGKNVTIVVTDRSDKSGQGTVSDRRKWGYASGGSGGPPSLRSIEVPTPTPTPPTPYRSVEGPLSNSATQRGQTTQRSKSRVDAMLERALTQPQQCSVDPLNNALNWGIPIWSTCELQAWLGKISASLKDSHNLKRDNHTGSGKSLKVQHLKEPYIKFESYRRESRPVFVELQSWPTLNFDGEPGTSPFDLTHREKKGVANKEIKENREKYFNPTVIKGKDMTRRPRATAGRGRKTENTGYCEICRISYKNLSTHLQSDEHLNFVRDDKNFLSLDNLISTGASVEAFLKINRSKDVSKDCDIFSTRDSSLDNGLLVSNEKSEKTNKSNLSDFNVDEMKMIQCNGVRRNLNLKLDSPHNLRTRTKHESGHLLRSMGRPYDEEEKSDKLFDKYTIKKRAKGTIWIEEDDSEDDKDIENEEEECDKKPVFEKLCELETKKNSNNGENPKSVSMNGEVDFDSTDCKKKDSSLIKVTNNSVLKDTLMSSTFTTKLNGYEEKQDKLKENEDVYGAKNDEIKDMNHVDDTENTTNLNHMNDHNSEKNIPPVDADETNSLKSFKDEKAKLKPARRGGRSCRGRHRLSVEERLIEDNRDYYKVEVLGNKLRSSAIPSTNIITSPSKEQLDKVKKEDKPSSEKPVVVRFKRVRKSELSLLSDEAESFMFGDPRRDDDFDSDNEQSSVLPKDSESDRDEAINSFVLSSSPANASQKQEVTEDESQDSSATGGRARKRRRTQTEALIMDNTDYYKFETPGSRLRYQAPLTGISDPVQEKDSGQLEASTAPPEEKLYPSKPSPEVEKMHFSFEAIPASEPWYQTYQRQDEGTEYWHYYSESDTSKPFLLPYEIENFHELLSKSVQTTMHRKRGRSRGCHLNMGSRSPRKSPRCHASTLAIMSTIIRRREQQQTNLSTIEEEKKIKTVSETTKPDKKVSDKSDVDEDLKEIVKNLDDMLSSNEMQEMDSFEVELFKNDDDAVLEPEVQPKGAPSNLLELLDNCHETVQSNGIENSSCASSECGEISTEFPLKRRKRRKNKTGWPGNKMKRKLHIKHLNEELQRALESEKNSNNMKSVTIGGLEDTVSRASHEDENNEMDHETGKENERFINTIGVRPGRGRKPKSRERKEASVEVHSKTVLKSVFGDEISLRKKRSESSDKCKVEESDDDTESYKRLKHLDSKEALSSASEDSEASLSNNENFCTKDTNLLPPHGKSLSKRFARKHPRSSTNTSEASLNELENQRRSSVSSSPKKQKDIQDLSLDGVIKKRGRKRSRKFSRNERSPRKPIFAGANCKKRSFLSSNEKKRLKKGRRNDNVSFDLPNGDIAPTLSERVSPSVVTSSDVDQRRSSIDFQPVVRVMKIEDQVDMDNSILSVAVVSNRRLRSSSSPRSTRQPPSKRFRHNSGRKQLGQWIKNS